MNSQELDKRIEELVSRRENFRASILTTSDKTRDIAGSVQHGLYWGQLAIGVFRKLTNYHISPKKRLQQVAVSVSVILVSKLLSRILFESDKEDT